MTAYAQKVQMQRDPPADCSPKSSTESNRKFIPLGPSARLPPKKLFPGTVPPPNQSDSITTSFAVVDRHKPVPVKLPDIYTTCPELRNFKPFMALPPVGTTDSATTESTTAAKESGNSTSGFDPNEPCLRPYVYACE